MCRVTLGKRHAKKQSQARLIVKGILGPNRQLVGFLASLGLKIPRPKEANMPVVILNVVHALFWNASAI